MGAVISKLAFMPPSDDRRAEVKAEHPSLVTQRLCSRMDCVAYAPGKTVQIRAYEPRTPAYVAGTGEMASIVVIYSHGNTGCLDWSETILARRATLLGITFVAYEYPGYMPGSSWWECSEPNANAAALAAYDWSLEKWPDSYVISWGLSLGSSFATHIATKRKVAGLVLQSPIASMVRHGFDNEYEPEFVEKTLDAFSNHRRLREGCLKWDGGVILIHGALDASVRPSNSVTLQHACEQGGLRVNSSDFTKPVLCFDLVLGRHHNNIPERTLIEAVTPLIGRIAYMHRAGQ